MVCTAPSTYFWNLVFYSFSAIPKHVFSFHAQSTISANGLGCLLQIRGAQCVFPICFCVNVACIHPLGFRSNSNLFPTLAQPCVSGFMPHPDGRIPMLKPCAPKKLVSYNRAFPVRNIKPESESWRAELKSRSRPSRKARWRIVVI